ncbi:Protein FAM49B [Orchesella cincta]|uniref:Protein FAM49B n=1 Tax=Orchesella cincta TaxID=48709 RepID=A0A1D2MP01_ORCCI|nr:Protein FAM49B [Orchesella cincta]
MGNLLRLLSREDCCSPQKYDVFLDFENAQPTEAEKEVYDEGQVVLERAHRILQDLQGYKGASQEIRKAIGTPDADTEKQAWEAVLPLVTKLKDFYLFSKELEKLVPKILRELCSGPMTPTQHLENQQALVKQFAEILEFTLKFDEYKMTTPAIQNDLSYYRRALSRHRMDDSPTSPTSPFSPLISTEDTPVSSELANSMSLFYAQATPMLRVLSDATSRFVSEQKEVEVQQTTETLGTMAQVCQRMLDTPGLIQRYRREETQSFVLRVMVGLVILYDHVHPVGAFVKASDVDVKGCVRVLKEQPTSRSEGLLNALRYTTKHLNDDSTPKQIKTMLAT